MKILPFAQAREVMGFSEKEIAPASHQSARQILEQLGFPSTTFPKGTRIALDLDYRGWDEPVGTATELAILPPVSGG